MVSSGQSQKYTYKVMARGRKEREIKRSRITVIGEGLTEKWYFEHLRSVAFPIIERIETEVLE